MRQATTLLSLFLFLGLTNAYCQKRKPAHVKLDEKVAILQSKIDSLNWTKEDRDCFFKVKENLLNDICGDVYKEMRTYTIPFVKKLNGAIELSELYRWDAISCGDYNDKVWGEDSNEPSKKAYEKPAGNSDRDQLLEQLKQKYPIGITDEAEEGNTYMIKRTIFINAEEATMLEVKEWDWGGKFHFKDGDIALPADLYEKLMIEFREKFKTK